MKLWIGNIAPGTSDEELRAFLARYGIETVASIRTARPAGPVGDCHPLVAMAGRR